MQRKCLLFQEAAGESHPKLCFFDPIITFPCVGYTRLRGDKPLALLMGNGDLIGNGGTMGVKLFDLLAEGVIGKGGTGGTTMGVKLFDLLVEDVDVDFIVYD